MNFVSVEPLGREATPKVRIFDASANFKYGQERRFWKAKDVGLGSLAEKLDLSICCPLSRRKQTSLGRFATSALCQKRTSPPHFRNVRFLGKRTFTEKLSPCVRYVNSDRILRPWAAYPLRIALWFGTRTSECWSKELRTRGGWSPLDPLC